MEVGAVLEDLYAPRTDWRSPRKIRVKRLSENDLDTVHPPVTQLDDVAFSIICSTASSL
jgi:hypothetical protein